MADFHPMNPNLAAFVCLAVHLAAFAIAARILRGSTDH
jgi:hypothetical protein